MTKQPTKTSEKRNMRARKIRNLPARTLGARKAASVKGGEITITKSTDKASNNLF